MTRREYLLGLALVAFGAIGLLTAIGLVTIDIPVYFGWVFLDGPDPLRPGHLKGVIVSTPELIAKAMLVVAALAACGITASTLKKVEAKKR